MNNRFTLMYEKDVEAMGGGIMLEKLLKKGLYKNLYQGIMYLKGRRYRIKIMTYRKGKGKIVEITLPGDKEEEIQYLVDLYKSALKNNEGNLYKIRQGRKISNYLSSVCITLQICLIITNLHRLYEGTYNYGNILIIIACIILVPFTMLIKERSLRL